MLLGFLLLLLLLLFGCNYYYYYYYLGAIGFIENHFDGISSLSYMPLQLLQRWGSFKNTCGVHRWVPNTAMFLHVYLYLCLLINAMLQWRSYTSATTNLVLICH